MGEKRFITNKKSEKLALLIDYTKPQRGLAFVLHGHGGTKEQAHIARFAKALHDKGYTVVRFDSRHTFGESDGDYQHSTVTSYLEDLETVIGWARGQSWFTEPFVLAGHSLGGVTTAWYAEHHPEEVLGLAPISTVVSGELSTETKAEEAEEWRRTGWRIKESATIPGRMKKIPWSHMEDRIRYDLLPRADQLTMPVLMIVGDQDDSTPLEHQRLLYDVLPGKKELHVLKNAPHTFKDERDLDRIYQLFSQWIRRYLE